MTNLVPMSVSDIEKMAIHISKSNLFGMKTPEQAFALMAIAHAEGMHPAIAARDYHIIQGRPALKADAMLARFQAAGGKVEWHDYTDQKVSGTFSHPQGGAVTIDWDMERAKAANLGTKDTWKSYPRQMLRSRVISEAIKTVFPGIAVGMYTVEEVQDFDNQPEAVRAEKAKTVEAISEVPMETKQLIDDLRNIYANMMNRLKSTSPLQEAEFSMIDSQVERLRELSPKDAEEISGKFDALYNKAVEKKLLKLVAEELPEYVQENNND